MSYDPILYRKLLEELEAWQPKTLQDESMGATVTIDGYSADKIAAHLRFIQQDGLITFLTETPSLPCKVGAGPLSAAGHRKLAELRAAGPLGTAKRVASSGMKWLGLLISHAITAAVSAIVTVWVVYKYGPPSP